MAQTKVKTKGITDTNVTNAKLGTDISAAKLTAGTVATARLGSGTASSSTILYGDQTYKTEPATYNDDALQNDIATLALHQATNANAAKYNLANTNVDVYQDSTGVSSFTDCARDTTGEYVSTVSSAPQATVIDMSARTGSLYTSDSDVLPNNNTNWTTECWARSKDITDNETPGPQGLFGQGLDHYSFNCKYSANDGGTDKFYWDVGNGSWNCASQRFALSTAGITSNTWHHVACVKTSTSYSIYIDGVLRDGPTTCTVGGSGNNYHIGTSQFLTNTFFYGYVTQWRVSSVARYSSGFTAPTAPFVNDSDTLVLLRSNTTNGSTTFTDSSSNGYTISLNGSAVDHTTDVVSPIIVETVNATGNYVSTATVANASVSKVGIVITYKNNAGTNTLNTDIVAQVSADGGSNYSTVTLAAAGTFSTGVLQAVANDVSVTAGTSIQYKISFANQASGSKEARITGASLIY